MSIPAQALDIIIKDQYGDPLSSAVVVIPSKAVTASDSPVLIDQVNRQFVPYVATIPVGQHVSFPNSDNIRHHVYSFSKSNPFEISLYAGREAKPIIFSEAGVVVIGCNIHDDMVGYVFVSPYYSVISDTTVL